MSTADDRIYTTTVGSQKMELPLVRALRRADDRPPHLVDMGVSFAETAGRSWPS